MIRTYGVTKNAVIDPKTQNFPQRDKYPYLHGTKRNQSPSPYNTIKPLTKKSTSSRISVHYQSQLSTL